MGLFDKLFGGGKKARRSKETVQTRGVHMPDLKIPVDEKFTIQFKKNGGKFIYCDHFEEVLVALQNIREENQWLETPFFTLNPLLKQRFSGEDITFSDQAQGSAEGFLNIASKSYSN